MRQGEVQVKAAVCREFGQPLRIEEVTIAAPSEGEVSIRLAACAICHSDIMYMDGAWGGTLPAVYGHEASGVVEAVGPGVTHLKPGDHAVVTLIRSCGACPFCDNGETALCDSSFHLDDSPPLHDAGGHVLQQGLKTGAFAEQVVVDASQVAAIPKDIPLDRAALLACGVITGLGAVTNTAKVPAGASVVVIGTGGVGLNSVQGAALSGADPIIAVDLSADKLTVAKSFGATHGFDPRSSDVAAEVRALTEGRGTDYVFATVGSKRAMEEGLGYLRAGGSLVMVGIPADGVSLEVPAADFASSGQRVIGSKMGSSRVDVDIPRLVGLYGEGRLKLDELISGRFPLERINEAVDEVRRGEALRNVIVF
jgi:Zn-dependent alcohol dehydrogenase